MLTITKKQARKLIQAQQGLLGSFRHAGKQGILEVIKNAGCIQYDPIDICGTNSQLVLYARVQGFKKEDLPILLYEKRALIDQMDKMMSIYSMEDWPFFERNRKSRSSELRSQEEIAPYLELIFNHIAENGPVAGRNLPTFNQKIYWYGGETAVEKAALETLYHQGRILVHHKVGTSKYYHVASKILSEEILKQKNPFKKEEDYLAWRIQRRIGAVGLMWNKASDAWLNIDGLTAQKREAAFLKLLKEEKIKQLYVQGFPMPFYYLAQRESLLEEVLDESEEDNRQIRFLPPLDQMLWDRKLIKALYDFDYTWEIYTPPQKRKYGPYIMPVLKGSDMIGRIQMKTEGQKLTINRYWPENGFQKEYKKEMNNAFEDFARFHQCKEVVWEKLKT